MQANKEPLQAPWNGSLAARDETAGIMSIGLARLTALRLERLSCVL